MNAAQKARKAVRCVEEAATDLLHFVETYNANAANCASHHVHKRRELFSLAREYAMSLRRLARLRP